MPNIQEIDHFDFPSAEKKYLGRKRTSWYKRNKTYIILWSVLLVAFCLALYADKASALLNQAYLTQ